MAYLGFNLAKKFTIICYQKCFSRFPYLRKPIKAWISSYLEIHEFQLEIGLLLQSDPHDEDKCVGLGLAHDDPSALLVLRGVVGGDDMTCCDYK